MYTLVRRFIKTGIAFLAVGLALGAYMLVQLEFGGAWPNPRRPFSDTVAASPRQPRAPVSASMQVVGWVRDHAEEAAMKTGTERQQGTADTDARLAEEVARALLWDLWVPDARVRATVVEGWVTLEGEVDSRCQREAAHRDVARIPGVAGVTNALTIRPIPPAEEVEARIAHALGGCAVPGAIRIETFPGAVMLRGVVASRAGHEAAGRAAGSVPGVCEVLNHLQVCG